MSQQADKTFESSYCGVCHQCRHVIPPLRDIARDYFRNGHLTCAHCGAAVDVWKNACSHVQAITLAIGLESLGATCTYFETTLDRKELKRIDFTQYGVPQDATILHVNYTPQTDCFPYELHTDFVSHQRWPKPEAVVYGRALIGQKEKETGERTDRGEGIIGVAVTWIPHDATEDTWFYLVEAFQLAAAKQFPKLLVPASSAVEIKLTSLLHDALKLHVGNQTLKEQMKDLTYSAALNVWLPMLCATARVPPLPDTIRGQLNRLRNLRNDYVHNGLAPNVPDAKEAGTLLAAAVFGFEYLRFLKSELQ